MKKLAATLLIFSMVLSLSVSGCRKSASSETRHRRTTASSEEAELPEAPQVEYNGSETAIFQIDPASAAGPNASEDELRVAYTRFIFDVVKRCAEKAGSQGILLSPDSVLFARRDPDATRASSNETICACLAKISPLMHRILFAVLLMRGTANRIPRFAARWGVTGRLQILRKSAQRL